jgi:hypothetical protein
MPPTKLTDLPREVLSSIAANLTTTDLKNARATCKTVDAVSVGLIFAHIILLPHRGCLQEFASAMKLSPVAHYIKSMTYDARWPALGPVLSHLKAEQLRRRDPRYTHGHDVILQFAAGELKFEETMPDKIQLLGKVLSRLPNLNNIRIHEEARYYTIAKHENIPAYFMSIAQKAQVQLTISSFLKCYKPDDAIVEEADEDEEVEVRHGKLRSATEVVLLCLDEIASNVSIIATRIEDYDGGISPWGTSETRASGIVPYTKLVNVLPRLKSFELNLMNFYGDGAFCGDYFGSVLAHAPNLKSLKLSMTLEYHYYSDQLYRVLPDLYSTGVLMEKLGEPSSMLTSLESLTLSGIPCLLSVLQQLLARCKSLKRLGIHNLYALEAIDTYSAPCLVTLLESLKDLKLDTVELGGLMWNGGNQRLNFEKSEWQLAQRMLMGRLEQWIKNPLDQEQCPLEPLRIRNGNRDLEPSNLDSFGIYCFNIAGGRHITTRNDRRWAIDWLSGSLPN